MNTVNSAMAIMMAITVIASTVAELEVPSEEASAERCWACSSAWEPALS